jgi:murein DD-endopeptidase MepM/ murein hydrolase activator NlpD
MRALWTFLYEWKVLLAVSAVLWLGIAAVWPQEMALAQTGRPFILPFRTEPGPNTWLLGQPYGNTTGAFRQRFSTYGASQGIHFGVDFTAPCGTTVTAVADGVVFGTDALQFGAGPHNAVIDHPNLGYSSLYGHLLARPGLQPGQRVRAGDVVGLSGDQNGNCGTQSHLHLEIRDLRHVRKYNPVLLVQADWDNLALTGTAARAFQRNLDNPRQWQLLSDQPEAVTGRPLLNNFRNTWPPDGRR